MSSSKALVVSALLLLACSVQGCTEYRCVVLRTPQWVYHVNSGWQDACDAGLQIFSGGMQTGNMCQCGPGYCLAYKCTNDASRQSFSGIGQLGTGAGSQTMMRSFQTSEIGSYEISTSLPGSSAEYHWSGAESGAGWRLFAIRQNCFAGSGWLTIS